MNALQPVSVLLVDDNPHFRQGLRTLLDFYNTNQLIALKVVGEAVSPDQALGLMRTQHPQLILLDLELSQGDGIQVLQRLKESNYGGKVLVLSAHREEEWVYRAMQAGAQGYLFKEHLATQLFEAIATLLRDQIYLSSEVITSFFRLLHFYAGQSLQHCQALHLTAREQEVLHWLIQGDSNELIAQRLYITAATVKAHLTAIFEKLGVTSRTQAIIKALKMGLVAS